MIIYTLNSGYLNIQYLANNENNKLILYSIPTNDAFWEIEYGFKQNMIFWSVVRDNSLAL